MPLTKPALPAVSAGQPVTAQGWNAILDALNTLFDGVNAFGTDSVVVNLVAGGSPVTTALVIAVPSSGQPVAAVPPFGTSTSFQLTNLTPGSWTIHVAAAGFNNAQQAITVPVSGPVSITLTSNGTVLMPQLFGLNAVQAMSALTALSISVQQIVDVDGNVISATSLPSDHTGSRVLGQFPAPGTRVVPAGAATRLVLSSATTKASKEVFEKPPITEVFEKTFDVGSKTADFVEKLPVLDAIAAPPDAAIVARAVDGVAGGEARVFIAPDERPRLGAPFLEAPRVE